MNKKLIKSMHAFLEEFTNYDLIGGTTIFRGQAQEGALLPGVARLNNRVNTTETEKIVLNELKIFGQLRIGTSKSTLELLVLAQHYGLKTRLLDWTSNPLAALWFACSDKEEGDVYVYAADATKHMVTMDSDFDPFAQGRTVVIRPTLSNDRILAQHGWFTLHRFSKKARRFVPLEEMTSGDLELECEYCIPAEARYNIILDLDRCGINRATLMPDLAGLCGHLNFMHKLT